MAQRKLTVVEEGTTTAHEQQEEEQEEINQLVFDTYHYALGNGILFLNRQTRHVHALPYTLYPKVDMIRHEQLIHLQELQIYLNELIHRISLNFDFMAKSFERVIEHDDFVKQLFSIYSKVDYSNKICMGVHRVDYMPHCSTPAIHYDNSSENQNGSGAATVHTRTANESCHGVMQMVEMNTISSGLGVMTSKIAQMHNHFHNLAPKHNDIMIEIPISESMTKIPEALRLGHNIWLDEVLNKSQNNNDQNKWPQSCVLFVVQSDEGNISDQRHLEYVLNQSGIIVLRRTLEQLITCSIVDEDTNHLIIDDRYTVSVVYYRAGYGPDEYPTMAHWETREKLEQSSAINCPTVGYQLVGAKKMQQVLADENVLRLVLSHEHQDKLDSIMETFTGIYSLIDPEHECFVRDAVQNPDSYVLKPHREGGGHLIVGEKMVDILSATQRTDEYILMRKICPESQKAIFVRDGVHKHVMSTSELGIYGTFIASGTRTYLNEHAGHLLRTKVAGTPEGGFWIGISVIDSLAFSK